MRRRHSKVRNGKGSSLTGETASEFPLSTKNESGIEAVEWGSSDLTDAFPGQF